MAILGIHGIQLMLPILDISQKNLGAMNWPGKLMELSIIDCPEYKCLFILGCLHLTWIGLCYGCWNVAALLFVRDKSLENMKNDENNNNNVLNLLFTWTWNVLNCSRRVEYQKIA